MTPAPLELDGQDLFDERQRRRTIAQVLYPDDDPPRWDPVYLSRARAPLLPRCWPSWEQFVGSLDAVAIRQRRTARRRNHRKAVEAAILKSKERLFNEVEEEIRKVKEDHWWELKRTQAERHEMLANWGCGLFDDDYFDQAIGTGRELLGLVNAVLDYHVAKFKAERGL